MPLLKAVVCALALWATVALADEPAVELTAEPPAIPTLAEAAEAQEKPVAQPEHPIERNLKDSGKGTVDTTDLKGMSAPLVPAMFLAKRKGGRRLQDGNPVFSRAFHDQPVNYFQMVLFDYNPNMNRIDAAREFIVNWMQIEPAKETLTFEQVTIKKRTVNNRYAARYRDSERHIDKLYYFDFDYSDGRSDRNRIRGVRTVDYLHNEGSNVNYLRIYEYTLEEDCRAIQEARHNPSEIECTPLVTRDNFVIPHVYNVLMRYRYGRRQITRRGRFFVRSRVIGPQASPLRPEPVNLPTPTQIIRMIVDRVRTTPFFGSKRIVLEQLRTPGMRSRISHYTRQIAAWEEANKRRLARAEQLYHRNLERTLKQDRRNKLRDDTNFDRTYNIMRRAASRINAFNIRNAIRRTARRLEDRQTVRAFRARARYVRRETALMELMEKLDHMRYLADKHLDDNFDHYYSPEYFTR